MEVAYRYDGSLDGFFCCIFEIYVQKEPPACFQTEEEPTLFPVRQVTTDAAHARRILDSLVRRSVCARNLVVKGFLTCVPEREMMLYRFIQALYDRGPALLRCLSDDALHPLLQAVRHLDGEVQLLRGFTRFSEFDGILAGEIKPKNRVLPLLGPHFRARMREETFFLYDRTHQEALFYQKGPWRILPLEDFQMAAPDEREAMFRRLWRKFYDTVAIEARLNPKLRMTHMPKRYWDTMTEFQPETAALPRGPEGLP